ncbi:hypothetical protein ABID56_001428 [Alkalibacillus flavidus]|uniref:SH3b domain-containing protein n=1 Tax=Alkalibacillus flavidus TaxID=546021 RepID=A0ABV2KUS4_9BACI
MFRIWFSITLMTALLIGAFTVPTNSSETTKASGDLHTISSYDLQHKSYMTIIPKQNRVTFETKAHEGTYVATTELNLRTGPATSFEAKTTLTPNVSVTANAKAIVDDKTWYRITHHDNDYWASAAYLTTPSLQKQKSQQSPSTKTQSRTANETTFNPMTIYVNGQQIPYENGGRANGQAIIDSRQVASTWGGAETFSGTDGLNTHFIGHNPGVFNGIWHATSFIITDQNGHAYQYDVNRVYQVDEHAIGMENGTDYWDRITGTSGGERVIFQACTTDDNTINWIIEADFVQSM